MKKLASASLLAVALLLVAAAPSHARPGFHHRHVVPARAHVFIGFGGPVWWGPPYWYYPPPYYVYSPPAVIIQQPPVYVQQPPVYVVPPAPPAQAAPPEAYWYYCSSAGAYYPNVQSCPEPWVKVAPRPQ